MYDVHWHVRNELAPVTNDAPRPHGGSYYCWGDISGALSSAQRYNINGESTSIYDNGHDVTYLGSSCFGTYLGAMNSINEPKLLTMLCAGKRPEEITNEYELARQADELKALGVLDEEMRPLVPVLTRAEHDALKALRAEAAGKIVPEVQEVLKKLFTLEYTDCPPHLTEYVPEWVKYMSGCRRVPMMTIEIPQQRGLWTVGVDERAPAWVVICEK